MFTLKCYPIYSHTGLYLVLNKFIKRGKSDNITVSIFKIDTNYKHISKRGEFLKEKKKKKGKKKKKLHPLY